MHGFQVLLVFALASSFCIAASLQKREAPLHTTYGVPNQYSQNGASKLGNGDQTDKTEIKQDSPLSGSQNLPSQSYGTPFQHTHGQGLTKSSDSTSTQTDESQHSQSLTGSSNKSEDSSSHSSSGEGSAQVTQSSLQSQGVSQGRSSQPSDEKQQGHSSASSFASSGASSKSSGEGSQKYASNGGYVF